MGVGSGQNRRRGAELEDKRAELASLRARHVESRAALQRLRDEIAQFEREYDDTLGRRMAELERLEAEIARLGGRWQGYGGSSFGGFSSGAGFAGSGSGGRSGTGDDDPPRGNRQGPSWGAEEQDIKSLYREVAKAIHPDLAGGAAAREIRNGLMSKANRAYADQDQRALREILRAWRVHHPAEEDDEVARLNAQIARERRELKATCAVIEELKGSYALRFKLRAGASGPGSGLFAELVEVADVNIARARKRLADLREELGEEDEVEEIRPRPRPTRTIAFPAGVTCGTLYTRERSSTDYSQWKKAAPARGPVQVEVDRAVRLDVKGEPAVKLASLRQLNPCDLQALFLYGVEDGDLDRIVHLTGLEELYLSGPALTDAALLAISTLSCLKRIYIYQTAISDRGLIYLKRLPSLTGLTSSGNSITDEGLAVFERVVPRVKTVSFRWKR